LQGLGLKVDLLANDQIVDAEEILAQNIKEEAKTVPGATPSVTISADDDVAVAIDEAEISEELAQMGDEAGVTINESEDITIDKEGEA
jgi:hypothetical protein